MVVALHAGTFILHFTFPVPTFTNNLLYVVERIYALIWLVTFTAIYPHGCDLGWPLVIPTLFDSPHPLRTLQLPVAHPCLATVTFGSTVTFYTLLVGRYLLLQFILFVADRCCPTPLLFRCYPFPFTDQFTVDLPRLLHALPTVRVRTVIYGYVAFLQLRRKPQLQFTLLNVYLHLVGLRLYATFTATFPLPLLVVLDVDLAVAVVVVGYILHCPFILLLLIVIPVVVAGRCVPHTDGLPVTEPAITYPAALHCVLLHGCVGLQPALIPVWCVGC